MATPPASSSPEQPQAYPLWVQNLVYKAMFALPARCPRLPIRTIAEVMRGCYNPGEFPAAICKLWIPTVTVVVFENGKFQLIGSHHHADGVLAAHMVARYLRQHMGLFMPLPFVGLAVCNVVESVSLGCFIDIDRFYRDHMAHCQYNPDDFEGLHYTVPTPDGRPATHCTRLNIFRTGRVVIVGGRSREEHVRHLRAFLPNLIQNYRCATLPGSHRRRTQGSTAATHAPKSVNASQRGKRFKARLQWSAPAITRPPGPSPAPAAAGARPARWAVHRLDEPRRRAEAQMNRRAAGAEAAAAAARRPRHSSYMASAPRRPQ